MEPKLTRGQKVYKWTFWSVPPAVTLGALVVPLGDDLLLFKLGAIACYVVLGVSLYVGRESNKLCYGILEVLFGVALISATIFFHFPPYPGPPDVAFWSAPMVTFLAQLYGGAFVMVRGLDNVEKGLPDKLVWKARWNWLMLKEVRSAKPD